MELVVSSRYFPSIKILSKLEQEIYAWPIEIEKVKKSENNRLDFLSAKG